MVVNAQPEEEGELCRVGSHKQKYRM